MQCNLVHASDSASAAADEITRFFQPQELYDYKPALSNYQLAADEQ
jgi:nucleoside-diphosphate kinase